METSLKNVAFDTESTRSRLNFDNQIQGGQQVTVEFLVSNNVSLHEKLSASFFGHREEKRPFIEKVERLGASSLPSPVSLCVCVCVSVCVCVCEDKKKQCLRFCYSRLDFPLPRTRTERVRE